MFHVFKRLWKTGNGTLPRKSLVAMRETGGVRGPELGRDGGRAADSGRDGGRTPDLGDVMLNPVRTDDAEDLRQLREELPKRIRKAFGRSLHIRHLDAGSSNACEWELTALLNPVYDVQRFGIDFVASPRHADMLLVTGGVTRNLEQAVRSTYDATPTPRLVVAVGDEACGMGFIGRTYAHYGGVDRIIPVDVRVPGDPPSPVAILQGILKAVDRTIG